MKRDTVAIIRAHLKTACVAAMLIQIVELVSIQIGGTSETVFETLRFRLVAGSIIVLFVVLMRVASYFAYVEPMYRRSPETQRFLIRMHHRFTGREMPG
ncbi:hypothetical protein [Caballeronia concitans]|jgi:hypothetical protein|uniref:Uncharacterized protein n=1 Tax=Caballeronia concitans TaxID=1777133 RepID=A0A658QUV1_9BURK|nr:hypothetical protein [Caballeronia concitans]KIG07615.1 hypothetical protein BurMR1_0445 [Burkholderia sp. MR1]SAL23585.1 hypothetical protein AWB72_01739 [Caballeronia concitans]